MMPVILKPTIKCHRAKGLINTSKQTSDESLELSSPTGNHGNRIYHNIIIYPCSQGTFEIYPYGSFDLRCQSGTYMHYAVVHSYITHVAAAIV